MRIYCVSIKKKSFLTFPKKFSLCEKKSNFLFNPFDAQKTLLYTSVKQKKHASNLNCLTYNNHTHQKRRTSFTHNLPATTKPHEHKRVRKTATSKWPTFYRLVPEVLVVLGRGPDQGRAQQPEASWSLWLSDNHRGNPFHRSDESALGHAVVRVCWWRLSFLHYWSFLIVDVFRFFCRSNKKILGRSKGFLWLVFEIIEMLNEKSNYRSIDGEVYMD